MESATAMAMPTLSEAPRFDEAEHQRLRAEKNYRKQVELQRELKKAHKNMMAARAHVTKVCHHMAVKENTAYSDEFKALRNTVRALKGKNLL